jgi:hypothetical protein
VISKGIYHSLDTRRLNLIEITSIRLAHFRILYLHNRVYVILPCHHHTNALEMHPATKLTYREDLKRWPSSLLLIHLIFFPKSILILYLKSYICISVIILKYLLIFFHNIKYIFIHNLIL